MWSPHLFLENAFAWFRDKFCDEAVLRIFSRNFNQFSFSYESSFHKFASCENRGCTINTSFWITSVKSTFHNENWIWKLMRLQKQLHSPPLNLGKNLPKVIFNIFLLRFLGTNSHPAPYNIPLVQVLRNRILR